MKKFINVRLKGSQNLNSIYVENGVIRKIMLGTSEDNSLSGADCETIDVKGHLVVPPYVDPHLHLDYVFTAGLGENNGSGTLFEGIQRWSESKGHMTVQEMKKRIYSGIKKERYFLLLYHLYISIGILGACQLFFECMESKAVMYALI